MARSATRSHSRTLLETYSGYVGGGGTYGVGEVVWKQSNNSKKCKASSARLAFPCLAHDDRKGAAVAASSAYFQLNNLYRLCGASR